MEATTIGLDLAKRTFEVRGVDDASWIALVGRQEG
jgi:hypothetical protein